MCMKSYESFLGVGCYGGWLHLLDHEFGPYQSNQVHQHNINNLYFGEERLLTGSWDQTAHIFSFADSQLTPLKRLDGFKHAVTCLNYQMQGTNYFIFGSQDGNIKIYDENNQFAMIASFKLHDNLIRQISAYRDKVVTCSNDCTIKFTKIDDYTHTTITDNSFIYGFEIFTVDDKEFLAYSNESRHIVVYNIDNLAAPLMVQCIELPSNAWDLKFYCNRLYAGLDSGYVASFTLQSQIDLSFQEHVQNFTNDITNATANEKGSSMSEAEVLKLPLTSEVGQYVGKKEGDTKIFREGTKPLAYMWKQGAWECLGEVVGKDAPAKVFYEGDGLFDAGEYDRVFYIDMGDGLERKLPFNYTDSATDAADKFCVREGIVKDNIKQIRDWIVTQTGEITEEMKAGSSGQAKQTYDETTLKAKFPYMTMFYFDTLQFEKLMGKLKSLNADNVLNEFMTLTEKLYGDMASEADLECLLTVIMRPPIKEVFPFYDVLRFMVTKVPAGSPITLRVLDHLPSLLSMNMMDINCITLIIRTVANLLNQCDATQVKRIVDILTTFNKVMAVFKMDNKTKQVYIQLCLNLSIKAIMLNLREPFEYLIMNESTLDLDIDQKYTINYLRAYGNMWSVGRTDNQLTAKILDKIGHVIDQI